MRTDVRQRVAAEARAELARQRRTQEELAEAIGLSQSTVSRYLRGEYDFRLSELQATADFFGVPLIKLLGEEALRVAS